METSRCPGHPLSYEFKKSDGVKIPCPKVSFAFWMYETDWNRISMAFYGLLLSILLDQLFLRLGKDPHKHSHIYDMFNWRFKLLPYMPGSWVLSIVPIHHVAYHLGRCPILSVDQWLDIIGLAWMSSISGFSCSTFARRLTAREVQGRAACHEKRENFHGETRSSCCRTSKVCRAKRSKFLARKVQSNRLNWPLVSLKIHNSAWEA